MAEEIVRVTLRLPKSLYEQIIKQAGQEHRSLNAQIIHQLHEHYPPPKKPAPRRKHRP